MILTTLEFDRGVMNIGVVSRLSSEPPLEPPEPNPLMPLMLLGSLRSSSAVRSVARSAALLKLRSPPL